MSKWIGVVIASVLFSAALLIPSNTQAAAPEILFIPSVQYRTQGDGRDLVITSITVRDLDGIDTLSVTVERPGVFGPFPLALSTYFSRNDTDIREGFRELLLPKDIPRALRAGDYLFKVADGTTTVSQTVTLDPIPALLPLVGPASLDTTTGILTPTLRVAPVPGALGYRAIFFNETDRIIGAFDNVPGPGHNLAPSVFVPLGFMEVGKFYAFRVEALNASSGRFNNRSLSLRVGYDPATGNINPPEYNVLSTGTLRNRVFLRTHSSGAVTVNPVARVRDRDGLSTIIGVTVERPGEFGPFTISPNPFPTSSDTSTNDTFFGFLGPDDIPASERAGTYLFKATDSGSSVPATSFLPSGLTPLPSASSTTVDTSTGLLTPTLNIDPVPGASSYRVSITNDTDSKQIFVTGVPEPEFIPFPSVRDPELSPEPTITLEEGVLEAGKAYRLRVEAFDESTYWTSFRRSSGDFASYNTATPETLAAVVAGLDLKGGLIKSLTSKLSAAQKSLDKGKDKTAANQMGAFVNEVEALVKSGRLDAASGAELIAAAEAIIAGL